MSKRLMSDRLETKSFIRCKPARANKRRFINISKLPINAIIIIATMMSSIMMMGFRFHFDFHQMLLDAPKSANRRGWFFHSQLDSELPATSYQFQFHQVLRCISQIPNGDPTISMKMRRYVSDKLGMGLSYFVFFFFRHLMFYGLGFRFHFDFDFDLDFGFWSIQFAYTGVLQSGCLTRRPAVCHKPKRKPNPTQPNPIQSKPNQPIPFHLIRQFQGESESESVVKPNHLIDGGYIPSICRYL